MKIDDRFHGISTLVSCSTAIGQTQGTGFFYQRLGEREKAAQPEFAWRQVVDTWLVTNRHVVLPPAGNKEMVPDSFAFHLRKQVGDKIEWDPIVLSRDQLLERAKFHSDSEIDVAIVSVLDLITEKMRSGGEYLQWHAVDNEDLPSKNNIAVEVSDDVIIIGYPRGFYDQVNLFPIVKSGVIASRWGVSFNGQPCFLIDAKLFPGSSGSIVVSKPKDIAVRDGKVMFALEKQFAFLGVFSGEPFFEEQPLEFEDLTIVRKLGFNVGIVWYGYLVDEIITSGQKYIP